MEKIIRFVAQCVDAKTGDMIEESIIHEGVLSKAEILKGLGYLHVERKCILIDALSGFIV